MVTLDTQTAFNLGATQKFSNVYCANCWGQNCWGHLLHNRHRRWGRDDFQPPPCTPSTNYDILSLVSANGEVAQLVEHHVRNVGVESSNLFFSTKPRETSKTRFRLSFRPRGVFCWQNCLTRPRLKPSISLVQGCLTRKDGGTEVCQADTTLRASPRIAPATQLAPPIAAPTGRPSAGGYSRVRHPSTLAV